VSCAPPHPGGDPLRFAEERSLQWAGVAWDRAQMRALLQVQYRARCLGYTGGDDVIEQMVWNL